MTSYSDSVIQHACETVGVPIGRKESFEEWFHRAARQIGAEPAGSEELAEAVVKMARDYRRAANLIEDEKTYARAIGKYGEHAKTLRALGVEVEQ